MLTIGFALLTSGCVVHHHDRGLHRGHHKVKPRRRSGPAYVQPRASVRAAPSKVVYVFDDRQRGIIVDYYSHHHPGKRGKHKWKRGGRGMPPGLAKRRGNLPPGLAKRDVLPPGIEMQALPEDLIVQLPPPPTGTRLMFYNDQVVMVELRTNIVLDVIDLSVAVGF
ncbi:MAG: hypothetical protein GWN72_22205 [Nitrospinaceae bacterium]|nr:hypothetical protein [Nitrospinaceae bacterium]NIU98926.1 hypothetical protein [Nitrospinaceae bacterium]NIW61477.1 hypothetical protein [Nitrospinaceae bacterium]